MRMMRWMLISGLATSALTIAGCPSNTVCGDGTELVDGTCVVVCGAGTEVGPDGTCVPSDDPITCGTGTTLNPATGMCEPDVVCAPGTTAVAGECVPDGSVICADGTTFDPASGTCILTGDACAEGTTLVDGECIPEDEALTSDVFAAAEPDDPLFFDGTPGSFFPPAIGAETTIGGCITPADFDSTVEGTEFDVDYFTFSTSDPGYYRIRADGLGGLAAGFAVLATDGSLAGTFVRVGLNMTGDTSERFIYLPRGGNYILAVFDSRSVALDFLESDGIGFARAVGSPDTCYHVTVEGLAVPAATPLTGSTATVALAAMPTFFTVTPSEGRVAFRAETTADTSPSANAAELVVSDNAVSVGFLSIDDTLFAVSEIVEPGDTALIVIDNEYNISFEPVTVDLTVTELGGLPEDGDVTLIDDDTALGHFLTFEATAGDVLHFRVNRMGVTFSTFGYGPEFSGGLTIGTDTYFRVERTGTQFFRVTNPAALDPGEEYVLHVTRSAQTPVAIAADAPTAVTLVDTQTFVTVNTSSQMWSVFTAGTFVGNTNAVDLTFFEGDFRGVLSAAASVDDEADVAGSFSRIYGPAMGADLLVSIADSTAFDAGDGVTLGYASETFTNIVGTVGTPVVRPGDTVAADSVTRYLVQGDPNGELTFLATPAPGVDLRLQLLDATATIDDTINDGAAGAAETFVGRFGENRFFAFNVTAGAAGGTYDVDVSVTPPPYAVTTGTTPFTSICPSNGGTGTEVTFDVAGVASVTPSTFAGFNFFGAPVSAFVVTQFGFMTFDTAYDGTDGEFNEPIGSPADPNNLIAAAWEFFFATNEACIQETAGQLIVEWLGEDGFTGDPQEVQVILTASTGTVELVYGSNGQELLDFATIGVENADASIGIEAPIPTPNTSILFTPPAP